MKGRDWIFDLANIHALRLPNKRAYHEINVEGKRSVLKPGIFKVVHMITYAIWAKCADVPFNDDGQINQLHVSE